MKVWVTLSNEKSNEIYLHDTYRRIRKTSAGNELRMNSLHDVRIIEFDMWYRCKDIGTENAQLTE